MAALSVHEYSLVARSRCKYPEHNKIGVSVL
jgi:hypothetical protein